MIPHLLFQLSAGAAAAIEAADGEIFYVASEDRTFAVKAEDRTVEVESNDRTFIAEPRPTP